MHPVSAQRLCCLVRRQKSRSPSGGTHMSAQIKQFNQEQFKALQSQEQIKFHPPFPPELYVNNYYNFYN